MGAIKGAMVEIAEAAGIAFADDRASASR